MMAFSGADLVADAGQKLGLMRGARSATTRLRQFLLGALRGVMSRITARSRCR